MEFMFLYLLPMTMILLSVAYYALVKRERAKVFVLFFVPIGAIIPVVNIYMIGIYFTVCAFNLMQQGYDVEDLRNTFRDFKATLRKIKFPFFKKDKQ